MKNLITTTLFFVLIFSAQNAYATVHTVVNNNDNSSGSLRFAIANSASGDTIAFSSSTDGTYTVLTSGEIEIQHSLVIMGNGIDNTLLSGDNNSRIFKVTAGNFELLSLTIREGLATGAGLSGSGGAILCDNNNQNTIKNARFINNNAHNSGAIQFYQANATVSQCIFAGNKADFSGGGIGVNQCNVTVFNSLISGNVAANGGGSGQGGGVSVSNGSSLTLVNSTVVNNYAVTVGAGINGDYNVSNSIVWGNFNAMMNNYDQINGSVTSQYSIIQNTILSGTGNIDGSNTNNTPQFKAPIPASATPSAGGDYRLKCSSPLIDRGDNLPLTNDLAGNPRVVDGLNTGTPTVDLGCYENQYTGPEFSQNNYELCVNNGPVQLNNTVSLPNGTFTGPGVQNNTFYPSIAGTGSHEIVYALSNSQGCIRTDTADFTVLAKPVIQVNITNTTCSGGDGAVDATITSPNSYNVYWSNGSTNEDIQDLNAGVYYITATDNNGCQATKMANVSSDAFTVSGTITDVSCHGGSDGNIDVTINGSTGPYTVEWLNNGSNAEDATNIVAGTWEVYVEDANGCAVSQVFEVGEPDDITWTETVVEATCGSSDGSAQCLVMGGTAPYNFQWFDASGSPVGTNADNLANITSGEYSVIITDDNGCAKIWNLFVTEVGGPAINIDTVINAQCANNGAIDISITSTNGIQSINWSNGATTEDLSGLAPGYYAVEVEDNSGCTGMTGVHVTNSAPEPVDICIVGVDTSTITNKVVWEKPVTTSISHYNIYRETSTAGQYQFVDSVLYANESFFVDTIAYPHIKSWRYKITAVNNCGVESDKSPAHKTIHLVKNLALGGGVNLAWDHYEGFSYPTYFVYRHTDVNGWEQIDQIASSASPTLNDVPPSTNQLDYFVSIQPPSVCESTKATSHNASRSNRSSGIAGPNGGGNSDGLNIEEVKMAELKLFPNPTTGLINIQWEELQGVAFYDVFDGSGKLVLSTSSNKIYETINLEQLERGIYIISITNNDVKQQYRVVKQ